LALTALLAWRLANETDDPLRKKVLRRVTRDKVGGELSRLSEYDLYTRARLAIDEFREELNSLDVLAEKSPPASLVEAAKDAETAIQRGLQNFPESSEILSAEASFRDLLAQTNEAQRALERAFALNPRQDWLAVRLARRYEDASDWKNSIRVLELCLQDNPSSKIAHLEYARVLMKSGDTSPSIIQHLKRSFTEGDNQYEAQFWYARELFLQGHFGEASKIFLGLQASYQALDVAYIIVFLGSLFSREFAGFTGVHSKTRQVYPGLRFMRPRNIGLPPCATLTAAWPLPIPRQSAVSRFAWPCVERNLSLAPIH
jgi:tetratricopeptide (TPR) repeat protein